MQSEDMVKFSSEMDFQLTRQPLALFKHAKGSLCWHAPFRNHNSKICMKRCHEAAYI